MKIVYLQIAIPKPLRRVFDYRLPDDWQGETPAHGSRIKVPFGKQSLIGVLIATHTEQPSFEVKPIEQVLDMQPLLDDDLMDLLKWAANYYLHPIGDVFATALPARLRKGKPAVKEPIDQWHICENTDVDSALARSPKQLAVYNFIAEHSPCSADTLNNAFENWRPSVRALRDKSLIESAETSQFDGATAEAPLPLNSEQSSALQSLKDNSEHFGCHLLFGITGCGKTEVYLQLCQHILNQGRQILVLVPEIGLTPQLSQHFQQRFNVPTALLHSGLSDGERQNAWLTAKSGEAKIIIGTRSAVFVPLASAGLIIMDEEHDASFKQIDGFRYSARDVAIKRASMLNIPILLGSATPSFETLQNASQGKFNLLTLNQRATAASKPEVYHVDMRNQKLQSGLTSLTLKAMDSELQQGGQVLVFLNRRGYAPALVCDQCGWIAECNHCDIRMTWHKRQRRLSCHVCNHETPVPTTCPDCGHMHFYPLGQGTERLEEFLQERFPDSGVVRIDRDSTRKKNSFETIIRNIRSGQHRILIGTQMLAKGHHFPQVGTVIIVDADNGLYGLDFRSQEIMAQLITQVAGRAGRETREGKVYIQTWHPEHPFFESIQSQHYSEFTQQQLKERQITGMPPYGFLALLRAEASKVEQVETFMSKTMEFCQQYQHTVELLGPAMAPLERKAGHYRMQLLFKSDARKPLHELLQPLVAYLDELKEAKRVRWSVDIDPYDLY